MKRPAILLLVVNALLLTWTSWSNSLGRTEVGHLGSAVYFWKTLRFDVFHVNPPLTRVLISLPIAACRPNTDLKSYSPRPLDRCEWDLGNEFLEINADDAIRRCVFFARCSLIPLIALGGYCGFLLSRDIFGPLSAYLFLALWCTSPLLLTWGATVCPDASAAALGVVGLYLLRSWLHQPTIPNAATAGIALGVLPIAKLTWIVAFAIWPLIWAIWRLPIGKESAGSKIGATKAPRHQMAILLAVAVLTINAGYAFEGSFTPLGNFAFHSQFFRGQNDVERNADRYATGNRFRDSAISWIPVPLPAEFIQGIDTQKRDFERGLPSFLRGEWADHGWWYYYLHALAIKEPLGTWCLLALAIVATASGNGSNAPWREQALVLLPGIAILGFVSSQSGFSVNSRYAILALPFFYLWISQCAGAIFVRSTSLKKRILAGAVAASLTWSVASSLWVYPHSLSYFNELVGGPTHGGDYLLGSNMDWGQDLFYLARWLKDHPEVKLSGMACESAYPRRPEGIPDIRYPLPGPAPAQHGGKENHAEGLGPVAGWYAVSANYLHDRERRFDYFDSNFEPVATVGYSIFIYHVTPEDARRARRKMGISGTQGHLSPTSSKP
jgi:hypothetical protein